MEINTSDAAKVFDGATEKAARRSKSFIQGRSAYTTLSVDVDDTAQSVILTTQDEEGAEILNAGISTIYLCEEGGTPDTDSYELRTGERIFLNGTIEAICDTGESTTMKVLRVR